MSERAIHVGVLVAALALSGWVFGRHRYGAPATAQSAAEAVTSPLAIVPPGSAFVLSADLAQLRRAKLGPTLSRRLGNLGSRTGDLQQLCGFDPLSALDQLALAVPSAGAAPSERADDYAVVATGRFSAAQIARCASTAIRARGGDPVDSQLGSFRSVRDRKHAGGEVAARDGGPLVVSGGSYLRELLDAADGNGPRREHEDPRDAQHAELRRVLGAGTFVATWLLGEGWLERVSGERNAGLSPLGKLRALAARVDVSSEIGATVLLDCGDATTASEIKALLEQLRSSFAALAFGPNLGATVQRVTLVQRESRLWLQVKLGQSELESVLDATLGPSEVRGPAPSVLPSSH